VPANSHNNLNRLKNYFSQLLNVCSVIDNRQIKIHTAELLLPHHNHLEVEITVVKLKVYKLPGSDHIPAELIPARGERSLRLINSVTLLGIRKNCLISGRSLLLYQFTRKMVKLAVVIIMGYH
jgi:hypothetical protein